MGGPNQDQTTATPVAEETSKIATDQNTTGSAKDTIISPEDMLTNFENKTGLQPGDPNYRTDCVIPAIEEYGNQFNHSDLFITDRDVE